MLELTYVMFWISREEAGLGLHWQQRQQQLSQLSETNKNKAEIERCGKWKKEGKRFPPYLLFYFAEHHFCDVIDVLR